MIRMIIMGKMNGIQTVVYDGTTNVNNVQAVESYASELFMFEPRFSKNGTHKQ